MEEKNDIRHGYLLSPLLFIFLQMVSFYDVQTKYLTKHPLSVTPQIPFFNIEFIDNTGLNRKDEGTYIGPFVVHTG
jgi:hypothetical protein